MSAFRISRAGVMGTILVLTVAAICVRLGIWQLDRLEQRRIRNDSLATRIHAPPAPFAGPEADTTGLLFRMLELEGEYDPARSVVLAGRSHRGAPGVHLLTPLRLGDGRGAILVDRGWIPSPDAATIDFDAYPEPGPIHVTAVAMPFPESSQPSAPPGPARQADPIVLRNGADTIQAAFRRVHFRVDVELLRAQFPYPIAAFYAQAVPVPDSRGYPVRVPPPELDEGSHFSYAMQWFSFGAIALIGWILLIARGDTVTRRPRT